MIVVVLTIAVQAIRTVTFTVGGDVVEDKLDEWLQVRVVIDRLGLVGIIKDKCYHSVRQLENLTK